jgi:SEC-C motif
MRQNYTIPTLPHVQPALDMNGGFLCFWTYWQPDPAAPDPEMPGLKQQMVTYLPVASAEDCLCGSGKSYARCCQRLPYWRPVCPDPGLGSYSLLAPQSATFRVDDGSAIHERLMDDLRLHCVEDTPDRAFWTLWGEAALESEYGIISFGDIELQQTLIASALSAPRMAVLLDLLAEAGGLPGPTVEHDPIPVFDKRTRERYALPPRRAAKRKRSRRRRRRA